MEKAIENLDRAAPHRPDLEKAKSLINLAMDDVRQAVIYADRHPGGASVAVPKPDFTPPPFPEGPAARQHDAYVTIEIQRRI
jgi:hypothetical protein